MFGDEFDQEQEDSQAEGQDPRLMQTLPEQGYQAMPQQPVQQRPVQQPMPQPVPEAAALDLPWQPADGQQLSKLMAGLSQATQDFFSGKILGDTFGQVKQQYMQRIGPLQARQQAQQQKAEQKAIRDAMQQQAMARVLQQKDQEHWASGFQGTVAHYIDQLTGKVTRFFNNGKSVEQVKEDKEPEIAALPLGGSSPATMLASLGAQALGQAGAGAQGGTTGLPPVEQPLQGPFEGLPEESNQLETPTGVPQTMQQYRQQSQSQGPRIYNALGQDITEQQAGRGGQPTRGNRDELGRLREPMGGDGETKLAGGLSVPQLLEIRRRATIAAGPEPGPGAPAWMHHAWHDKMNGLMQKLAGNILLTSGHEVDLKNAGARAEKTTEELGKRSAENQKLQQDTIKLRDELGKARIVLGHTMQGKIGTDKISKEFKAFGAQVDREYQGLVREKAKAQQDGKPFPAERAARLEELASEADRHHEALRLTTNHFTALPFIEEAVNPKGTPPASQPSAAESQPKAAAPPATPPPANRHGKPSTKAVTSRNLDEAIKEALRGGSK